MFWYENFWNIVILAMFTKASLLQNWAKLPLFGFWQVYLKFPVQKSFSNQFFITAGRPLSTRKPRLGVASIYWGGTLGSQASVLAYSYTLPKSSHKLYLNFLIIKHSMEVIDKIWKDSYAFKSIQAMSSFSSNFESTWNHQNFEWTCV